MEKYLLVILLAASVIGCTEKYDRIIYKNTTNAILQLNDTTLLVVPSGDEKNPFTINIKE